VRTFSYAVLISSVVGFSTAGQAAPLQLYGNTRAQAALEVPDRAPISLLGGRVTCEPSESTKVCDVRHAAAQRAREVVVQENAPKLRQMGSSVPLALLVPISSASTSLTLVRAIECDPALSVQECEKLNKQLPSIPPGPLPPTTAPPPISPIPPAVPDLKPVQPPTAVAPVPIRPPSVLPPPPTGDDEIVKPPPATGSQMPVIKPKAAPPVNPQP